MFCSHLTAKVVSADRDRQRGTVIRGSEFVGPVSSSLHVKSKQRSGGEREPFSLFVEKLIRRALDNLNTLLQHYHVMPLTHSQCVDICQRNDISAISER